MKLDICHKALILAVIAFLACNIGASAQQQKAEEPDLYEQAEAEADRLQRILDLEDWQTFYVDSTLKHDYPAMMEEIEKLREAKITNIDIFQSVQDKWWDSIDASYRRIFNDEQWKAYLKTGAGKAQKLRAKRKTQKEE